jgi:hypothetical protein
MGFNLAFKGLITKTFLVYLREIMQKRGENKKNEEREREIECMCVIERERECVCACVCVRERERERETSKVYPCLMLSAAK